MVKPGSKQQNFGNASSQRGLNEIAYVKQAKYCSIMVDKTNNNATLFMCPECKCKIKCLRITSTFK